MTTYIREMPDGTKVEYRRNPYHPEILFVEGRVLRRDGTPFDERWYATSDREFLGIQLSGSDILDLLSQPEAN